jgi:hypothetical protein
VQLECVVGWEARKGRPKRVGQNRRASFSEMYVQRSTELTCIQLPDERSAPRWNQFRRPSQKQWGAAEGENPQPRSIKASSQKRYRGRFPCSNIGM